MDGSSRARHLDWLGRERSVRPRHWGQPLVCFPRCYGRCDVPHQSGHLDLPATQVDGVLVRVEMTGEPGDVFVMHPAALHAAAPNALETPRLVLAQFVPPKA